MKTIPRFIILICCIVSVIINSGTIIVSLVIAVQLRELSTMPYICAAAGITSINFQSLGDLYEWPLSDNDFTIFMECILSCASVCASMQIFYIAVM